MAKGLANHVVLGSTVEYVGSKYSEHASGSNTNQRTGDDEQISIWVGK